MRKPLKHMRYRPADTRIRANQRRMKFVIRIARRKKPSWKHPDLASLVGMLSSGTDQTIEAYSLNSDIEALLVATAILIEEPEDEAWAAFTDPVDHKSNARILNKIRRSSDPLSEARKAPKPIRELIAECINPHWSRYCREIVNGSLPPDILNVKWDELSLLGAHLQSKAESMIIHHLLALAQAEAGKIGKGAPFKGDQDAALEQLALIYVQHSGQPCSHHELSPSPKGRFIKFAHAVLKPYFATTEITRAALGRRWSRHRDRRTAPPFESTHRPRRHRNSYWKQ